MDTQKQNSPLVVVGVDGSRPSVAALKYAKRSAEKSGARLRAVAVWSYPVTYSPIPLDWSPRGEAVSQLAAVSLEVFGDAIPDWYEQVVSEGLPAARLIAECEGADLLVVGSRGHGGFVGLLLGSVSSQCAGHAGCPVVIVHGGDVADDGARDAGDGFGDAAADDAAGATGAPVVVGHDGSAGADEALEWALRTAETVGAPVEVLRTWSIDRLPRQFNEEFGYVPSYDEVTAHVRRDLVAETQSIVDAHPAVTVTLRAALAQPAEELIRLSSEARMLVVGTRGRGGFAGLILGSVSSECAAHAHCPVAVVPLTER